MAVRESETRYRALFEIGSDAIVLIDATSGEIKEANQLAHDRLGYSREQLLCMRITDIEGAKSAGKITRFLENINAGSSSTNSIDTQLKSKSGAYRNIRLKSKSIIFNEKPYFLCTWHDT